MIKVSFWLGISIVVIFWKIEIVKSYWMIRLVSLSQSFAFVDHLTGCMRTIIVTQVIIVTPLYLISTEILKGIIL